MAEIMNYNEVEVEAQVLDEKPEGEIISEEPVNNTSTEVQETEKPVKKPGKVKRFFKGAWGVTKKVLPLGAAYSLGYATKAALVKFTGSQVTTGGSAPALPEVKTETIDLGQGIKADVTNF